MTSLCSAVGLVLIASALPIMAQERLAPESGPIHQFLRHEAARLTAESARPVPRSGQERPLPPSASPAAPLRNASWTRVRALVSGTEVQVKVHGSTSEREFVRASDDVLTVKSSLGTYGIARDDVQEITRPSHRIRTAALIGAGVGALVGALSLSGCSSSESVCGFQAPWSAMFAGIGAGSGAGIGALIGDEVIYRAP